MYKKYYIKVRTLYLFIEKKSIIYTTLVTYTGKNKFIKMQRNLNYCNVEPIISIIDCVTNTFNYENINTNYNMTSKPMTKIKTHR